MISCDQHDYIEIACMYNFPIRLTLKYDIKITCKALDTQQNEHCDECIRVALNKTEKLIPLNDIKKMEVLIDNPHFQVVSFN